MSVPVYVCVQIVARRVCLCKSYYGCMCMCSCAGVCVRACECAPVSVRDNAEQTICCLAVERSGKGHISTERYNGRAAGENSGSRKKQALTGLQLCTLQPRSSCLQPPLLRVSGFYSHILHFTHTQTHAHAHRHTCAHTYTPTYTRTHTLTDTDRHTRAHTLTDTGRHTRTHTKLR